MATESTQNSKETWRTAIAHYQKSSFWRASWQLANSVGSYVLVWALMIMALQVAWWLVIPLVPLAAGLLIRIFIIFHDCGHASFFKSRRANDFWGFLTGVLTFTPYQYWRWQHAVHHATAGNLDKRGMGDIWTLTMEEYIQSTRWRRFAYRLARNPLIVFVIAPLFLFLFYQRFAVLKCGKKERQSVWWTNLAIVGVVIGMSFLMGLVPYLLIQIPIMALAGSGGIWLFYVQHQFEDVYWKDSKSWDFVDAAIKGSSFYKLPKILQWFSGNIGFHHIHHLSPRVPNYHLEKCHYSLPLFQEVKALGFLESLKSLKFRLFDESSGKLVGYRHLREIRKSRKTANTDR